MPARNFMFSVRQRHHDHRATCRGYSAPVISDKLILTAKDIQLLLGHLPGTTHFVLRVPFSSCRDTVETTEQVRTNKGQQASTDMSSRLIRDSGSAVITRLKALIACGSRVAVLSTYLQQNRCSAPVRSVET